MKKSTTFALLLLASALDGSEPRAAAPRTAGTDLSRTDFASPSLAEGFRRPPPSSRPWVYWFWLDGNITREGITADLEAMVRVGIGGVLIMEVAQGTPEGPVAFGTPAWRDLFHFALTEARRLGLQVSMNNAAGWCGSGGPWITPELAMQNLTFSETFVEGPMTFDDRLPQPVTVNQFYRDVAVLAFPAPLDDDVKMAGGSPKITASVGSEAFNPRHLLDGNRETSVTLPAPNAEHPPWLQIEFTQPYTVRTVIVDIIGHPAFGVTGVLETSENGREYKMLREFVAQPPTVVFNVAATTARWFRVSFIKGHPRYDKVAITGLELSPGHRIENLAVKADVTPAQFTSGHSVPSLAHIPTLSPTLTVARDRIVELTDRCNEQGHLRWEVPQGKWTILRIGRTLTGRTNHPAPKVGFGLECDKLSREAAQAAFRGLIGKLVTENRDFVGQTKTLVATHIDSWEVGSQNWTPLMREEFRRLRGYDPLKYLPVVTGRVVTSPEVSERFLWDLRQTVGDLVRENYAGEFRRLAHEYEMQLSIEGYYGCPTSEIAYGGEADQPMGEFWRTSNLTHYSCLAMASAAHVYGHRIVPAEAFTASARERWQSHPGELKELGDWAFCEGVNRLVFHRYAMQPWRDRRPGMSMGPFGLHYERTQTWWEQSRAWHEYLSRCQFLLQQGLFVADVCCVQPEGAPMRFITPKSLRPANSWERPGYNFDGCPPEAVLKRMSVRDGRLVLPDGMSYYVLLLPEVETMTPELLAKITELVDGGATVIGPKKPLKSPSLSGYPQCDQTVKRLADDLWDRHRIITDMTPAEVLAARGLPLDFSSRAGQSLRFTHRVLGDTDVYFVSNRSAQAVETMCAFRMQGKRPELWRPETGQVERLAVYDQSDGCVRTPLRLESHESVFVVFRRDHAVEPDRITSVTRNGKEILQNGADAPRRITNDNTPTAMPTILLRRNNQGDIDAEVWQPGEFTAQTADGRNLQLTVAPLPDPQEITGPWEVRFDPEWGGPGRKTGSGEQVGADPIRFDRLVSWTQRPELAVRHYSGTAIYRTSFERNAQPDMSSLKWVLDLGRVAIMAEVTLNGRSLGVVWKSPFWIDVTSALQPGRNVLEVAVTNLWINRQIGDEQFPEDSQRNPDGTLQQWPEWIVAGKPSPTGRYTFTTWRLWKKDEPLAESGLLGPVVLQPAARTMMR